MSREKSSKSRDKNVERTLVRVNFNYSYTHKSKLVEIVKGELLELLQKTNEHWWKCLRKGQSKGFYVPASYVSVLDSNSEPSYSTDEEVLEESGHPTRPYDGGKSYGFMFRPELDLEDNQSLSSIPSSIVVTHDRVSDSRTSLAKESERGASSSNNSNLSKDTYWSKSLEELARQIVFPGQSSIYFNNPVFNADSSDNLKVESGHQHQQKSPRISLSSSSIECNDQPEVHSDSNKSFNHASDDDDGTLPRSDDFVRQLSCNWSEYKSRTSQRVYYYNSLTKSRSWKPPRLSKEESNNNVFQIPKGWTQNIDETNGTVSFVNQATGSKWFTSTDPTGKIYFYEENSSKSSWFLPDETSDKPTTSTSGGAAPTTQVQESICSSCDSSEVEDSSKLRNKRHSTGERETVVERNNKAVSLFLPETRSNTLEEFSANPASLSLPHSIWNDANLKIVHEYYLNRTRIRENNKKVRKHWVNSWAVLTQRHLSFFKDPKYRNAQQIKSDLEIDLSQSKLEWTDDKSSKKNVFQITNPNIHLLCQCNNEEDAGKWYNQIFLIISSLHVDGEDVVHRYKGDSMEYLNISGSESSIKRRGTTKSGKLPITTTEDNGKSIIRSQLLKFLNRRPPKESLVKKGILKDSAENDGVHAVSMSRKQVEGVPHGPVFGCTVEQLTSREGRLIPLFVERCIQVIESKEENLMTDGIYRASGNLSQVQTIRYQVDQNNLTVLEKEEDVHVLAGSLKLFFREMREPLLPNCTFNEFLSACQQPREQKLREFKSLLSALPKPNHATLKRLLEHLLKVSKYSEYNRMQIPNLAIVFGPTVMWNAAESVNMATDLMQQNYVVEILLSDFATLFS